MSDDDLIRRGDVLDLFVDWWLYAPSGQQVTGDVCNAVAAIPAVTVGVKQLREAFDAGQDHGWDQGKTDACGGPEPVSNDEAFAAFLSALEPQPAPDMKEVVDTVNRIV